MSSSISSVSTQAYAPPTQLVAQAQPQGKDSDGDYDGSKTGEVEKPKATTGSIGTIIDTKA